MNEFAAPTAPSAPDVRTLLHTIAQLLRHAQRLGPESQALLADLVDELASSQMSPAQITQVAASAAHLAEAVHAEGEAGVFDAARERLERVAVAADTSAPGVAGLARRFAEMLSNVGI